MHRDRLEITKDHEAGKDRVQYRARIMAGNGEELFKSSEGYNNLEDLLAITSRLFPDIEPELMFDR